MKKTGLVFAFLLTIVFSANAQSISENAIGIRFGDNNGFGGEFSYQRALGGNNRLEIDLGIRGDNFYSGLKATGLYQWVFDIENQFHWYVGAGGGFGTWKVKNSDYSGSYVFGAGVIGIEYNFDFPLLISLDFRPEIGFDDFYDGFNSDFGLGVRYQF